MKYDESNIEHRTKWNIRRIQILHRDRYSCVICSSTKNLQVHHSAYDNKLNYWEYQDSYLHTLCASCHSHVHNKRSLSSFYSKKRLPKMGGMYDIYRLLTKSFLKKGVDYRTEYPTTMDDLLLPTNN